jgi:phospholipase/carboxylesterase
MHSDYLPCVELEPDVPAKSTVIWLHGLGADGHDFEPVVPWLAVRQELGVRFVFPHAPARPVTINAGMVMTAWYDIFNLEQPREIEAAGVRESALRIRELIARENERGVPADRIVLVGFSQGGAIALHVGLRYPERLAALVGLSAYLVCEESLEDELSEANRSTPIFQAHGIADPMVALTQGEHARDRLRELGYAVDWHSYPMGHEVHPDEIRAIGELINRQLPE